MGEIRRVAMARGPVDAVVRPPGSKSITIRALAAAALAEGRSHIYGPLVADDTAAMVGALRSLGVDVEAGAEPWTVDGPGGHLRSPPDPVDAGESGLTARISMVLAALAEGTTTITGRGRLLERPIAALVDVLAAQGVSTQATDGCLPVTIDGQGGLWGGNIEVDCSKSSQFGTAVLLAAPVMTEPAIVRLIGLSGSAGYLDTTIAVMESFGAPVTRTIGGYEIAPGGYRPTDYLVEPDASAAVYPLVAAAITGGRVLIEGLSLDSTQPDVEIARHLHQMGCAVEDTDSGLVLTGASELRPIEADLSASPDGALGLAVACAFATGTSRLSGLHSLRFKESDRLAAMSTELAKLGVTALSDGDTLVVSPGRPHGAVIHPHGDHRIAMSLAVAGLRIEGVQVADSAVVSKTWPGFWDSLASLVDS